jgi:[acyl-carrier-protein] S-malonyltransferase
VTKIALVFPGQGCQYVGMGTELYNSSAEARAFYQHADDLLGLPLSRLCFEGPEADLNDTANTQPAIYISTLALWRAVAPKLEAVRGRIACVAGHSLGEFSALAVAGALSIEDGLKLVRRRGEAMRDAGEQAPGGMAAIIGLEDDDVVHVVAEANASGPGVWVANYNSPGQVVIAGANQALARAMDLAKARGAKRALPLAVSVACHTPLMTAASERLGEALAATPILKPWVPVVSNAEAMFLSEPEAIHAALLKQLSSPVRWVESVQQMVVEGISTVIEIGPKSVVAGLIKRIEKSLNVYAITTLAELEALNLEVLA